VKRLCVIALLVAAWAIYPARVVLALLALLAAERDSYGGFVTVSTIVLAAAGLAALVRSANRRSRRNIGI
jgi:hypothetical protein